MEATHFKNGSASSGGEVLSVDIDAILAAQSESDEGFTREEWQQKLGVGEKKMRQVLKEGMKQGLFTRGKAQRQYYNGIWHRMDVYKYVGGDDE